MWGGGGKRGLGPLHTVPWWGGARVGRCKNARDIGAYCRGSGGAGRAPSQRPVVRGEGSWENIFVADGQWKHNPGLVLPNQTWVCSPARSKAHLLTPRCGEGKCSVCCRTNQEVQAANAQKAQTPHGFQGKVFKDRVRERELWSVRSAHGHSSDWLVVR